MLLYLGIFLSVWYAHGPACEVGCQVCWCQIVCVCACARMAVRTHTTARTVDSQFHGHLCLVKIEKQNQKGHCPSEKRCTFQTISLTYVEPLTNIREWSFLHANSETHVQSKLNTPPNLPLVGGWYSRGRNTRGCAALGEAYMHAIQHKISSRVQQLLFSTFHARRGRNLRCTTRDDEKKKGAKRQAHKKHKMVIRVLKHKTAQCTRATFACDCMPRQPLTTCSSGELNAATQDKWSIS